MMQKAGVSPPFPTWPAEATAAFRLLVWSCQFLETERASASVEAIVKTKKIDWPALMQLATLNGVRPQLYEALKPFAGEVDAEFWEQLRQSVQDIAIFNLLNGREMVRIIRLLASEGITCIPYKGAWMAASAYSDLRLREFSDIDLFIYHKDIPRIKSLMLAEGYAAQWQLDPREEQRLLERDCEINFQLFEGEVRRHLVEFHWKLASRNVHLNLSLSDLDKQLVRGTLQGISFPVFSPAAHLLTASLHHGGKDFWWRLKEPLDVARLVHLYGDNMDWDGILNQARRVGGLHILLNGLGLQQQLFGVPLPENIARMIQTRPIQDLVGDRLQVLSLPLEYWTERRSVYHRLSYRWRSREHVSDRLYVLANDLWKSLRPQPEDLERSGLPPWMGFMLPLIRLFRLTRNLLTGDWK